MYTLIAEDLGENTGNGTNSEASQCVFYLSLYRSSSIQERPLLEVDFPLEEGCHWKVTVNVPWEE